MKDGLHNDMMICFLMVVNHEDEAGESEEQCVRMSGDLQDEEGWTTVVPKWKKKLEKKNASEDGSEVKTPKDLGKEVSNLAKYKWVPRADLVQD